MTSRGFTLIEVIVSLTIGAVVVLIAHELLTSMHRVARNTTVTSRDVDRRGNRHTWLIRSFQNIQVSSSPARGFDGVARTRGGVAADSITFFMIEPRSHRSSAQRVTVTIAGERLIAVVTPEYAPAHRDTVTLVEDVALFEARYLNEYGAASLWLREWRGPTSAPLAIRVIAGYRSGAADTLFMHVGVRG